MEGTNGVQRKRKKTRPPRGAARPTKGPQPHLHPLEVRRKAVQLYLEEGFSPRLIAREMKVGLSTLSNWVRLYRAQGEAGLRAIDHDPGGVDLVVGPGRRRLDIDDDRVLDVHEIVEAVAKLDALVGLGRPGGKGIRR